MVTYNGTALTDKILSKPYGLDPYLPSKSLVKAVNLAMVLKRPLLLKGEPGCGKSRLAEAVAAELHGTKFGDKYFRWNVKSTDKAQNGLYVIDNLQRLQNATFKKGADAENLDVELFLKNGEYLPEGRYIKLGKLGQAFQMTHKLAATGKPPVILIDEIDKADIDFPNDLLLELDKMEFEIPEIQKDGESLKIKAHDELKPLFIITSNDEKPLPPAFLRRCMFHYIDFTEIKLFEIVNSNYEGLGAALIKKSIGMFEQWRAMIEKKANSNKNISTSELLDWMKLISHYKKENDPEAKNFIEDNLPMYYQSLLKDVESIQLFGKNEELKPVAQ